MKVPGPVLVTATTRVVSARCATLRLADLLNAMDETGTAERAAIILSGEAGRGFGRAWPLFLIRGWLDAEAPPRGCFPLRPGGPMRTRGEKRKGAEWIEITSRLLSDTDFSFFWQTLPHPKECHVASQPGFSLNRRLES